MTWGPLHTTVPTVSSVSTTADNQSAVSITDNITVTFSEAMDYTSITTNIDNSSCYGTLMVSSDNFSNCVQMASPNKALDFDGTNDYVAVSNPSSIPVGIESYTIEAWFYADQMGTRGIVGWGNYGSYNQVTALRLHGSNGFRHYWWANDLDVTTGDISGAWHHVAVTWDGTDRKLYLDGVFKKGDQPSGHAVPNASNFRIGSTNNGEYFDGKIDEIRIWSEARTQPEIQATMNNTLTGSEGGLVAYYKMNDGSGTSLADSSRNSNTATMINMSDADWIQGNASFSNSPSSSNSDMTFTLDPSDNLTVGTTYLTRVTTGVKDASGNAMSSQYDNSNGFTTFSFQPQTKAELETAVDLWTCSYESTSCDNNLALATYGEINTWDVSLITSMTNLFEDKTTFNDNISAWDVSSVTTMQRMFQNAWVFNQDISSWNVSNVTNMLSAFEGAYDFNQDIGSWDVSSVTNMENMIYIAKDFNQDISDWDVSNVTNMSWMFARTDNFTQDISGWDVSNVTRMDGMFHTATAINQDLSDWDISSVTNMVDMFKNANALSDANKCLIHTDFDNNSNWPYDWSGSCD